MLAYILELMVRHTQGNMQSYIYVTNQLPGFVLNWVELRTMKNIQTIV